MPVDDVGSGPGQAELGQHVLAGARLARQLEVGVLLLGPRRAIGDERALERLHRAAAQGRPQAAPQVPHPIEGLGRALVPGDARHAVAGVEVGPSGNVAASHADRPEAPVCSHGNAAMEQQVVVVREVD